MRKPRQSDGKANRYVGLGSRSDALLRDVQRLLNAFGVSGRIYSISEAATPSFSYTRNDGTHVEYLSRQGFDLRITGTDLETFADQIGFSTPRKQAALEAMLGETGRYATTRGITLLEREIDGQEEVPDLTEPFTTPTSWTGSWWQTAASTCTSTTRRATWRR